MKRWWLAVLLGAALAGCHRTEGMQRSISLSPCRLQGVDHEARCGTFDVWENRETRRGRKLHLHLAVVTSLAPNPAPDPIVVLAGGPGQAAVELAHAIMPAFEQELRHRDLVFVDQRGTGQSNPLECAPPDGGSLDEDLSDAEQDARLRRCLAHFDADPTQYTTPIAMDDLDDVRAALGYPRINLWGGSYGTRAALVYMRRHPDRVRTATLDGVAPTNLKLPLSFAPDGQRALDLLFRACAETDGCAKTYPGLKARFWKLLAELDQAPAKTKVANPVNGALEDVTVDRRDFVTTLRGLLYLPEAASLMPLTIDRAAKGDFTPFVAESHGLVGGFSKTIANGMFYSVICAEDAPRVRPEEIDAATRDTFLGRTVADQMLHICSFWPRGTLPPGYAEPVRSEAPTLLLSGELDPVTPPEHAAQVAKTLPHSLHLVIPGVGHGATEIGCVAKVVADFIDAGKVEGLDTSCTRRLTRPPFFLTFAGPTP